MNKKIRDEFSLDVKQRLAARVGHLCSNPNCKQPTSGPSEADKAVTNVGVGAHITAASEGGPRYDSSLTEIERSGQENGIWLCQKCAKAVDDDKVTYTVELLKDWRNRAEDDARNAIEKGVKPTSIKNLKLLVHKAYFNGNPIQHFFIKLINSSETKEIEITHVWYKNENRTVEVLTAPLPKRLKPDEIYETWVPVDKIPNDENVYQNFHAVISTGEVFTSKQNIDVRPFGFIAGL